MLIFSLATYESDGMVEGHLRNFWDAISANVADCSNGARRYFIRRFLACFSETGGEERGRPKCSMSGQWARIDNRG
jgi:hypothetical protein